MIKINLIDVVNDLIKRSEEEEWFEFKVNWFEEEKIGQYIYLHYLILHPFWERNMVI